MIIKEIHGGYSKTANDTAFANDSTLIVLQYSENLADGYDWKFIATLDTIVKFTNTQFDTTIIPFVQLDTLDLLVDFIRLTAIHRHITPSDLPGLFENSYTSNINVGLKGIK